MSADSTPHSELRQRIAMGIPRRNPVWTSPAFPSWEQVDDARDALDKLVEQNESLRAGLDELLSVAERIRGGDSKLNPEEWYAARDYARATLARYPATERRVVRRPDLDDHSGRAYEVSDPASEPEAT